MSKQTFYYSEGPYLRSLQSLHYALVNSETFIHFMGSPGSGKTTLCDKLALYMERKGHEVFFIDRTIDSPEMLRAVLANKFNLPSSNNFARLLEDSLAQAEEKIRVLIFDDAHLLSDITLIEIHRLSEIQVNSKRLLNIVLCGEPQLEKRLSSQAESRTLTLNVSHKFLLEPMSQEEVGQFVAGYISHSGFSDTAISTPALGLIFRSTKGFPGPAILIAQLIADARRETSVASELSKERLARLIKVSNLQAALPTSHSFDPGQLKVIAPIAAVFTIAVLGFLFQLMSSRNVAPTEAIPLVESATTAIESGNVEDSPFANEAVVADPVEAVNYPSEIAAVSALESEPRNSAPAAAEPRSEPVIPSLLRPAPLFSVEEEPVSDSNLSLVTAAEIGITGEVLQLPDYADLVVVEAQQASRPESAAAGANQLISDSPPAAVPEGIAAQINVAVPSEPENTDTAEEALVESSGVVETSSQLNAQVLSAEPVTASLELSLADSVETSAPPAAKGSYIDSIDRWLDAWANQDMEAYFASYDEEFEPRYDDTLSRWRRNRTRVITNADSIKLDLSELSVVAEDDNTVEVSFWLAYESPTYSDSTLKKLILSNASGRWLILEEINLQVRP